jgi:tetratricopeptide (TPR) repeat protein
MSRLGFRTRLIRCGLALAAAASLAAPALGQSTGMVKGKVVDAEGKPVEGAKITIEFTEGVNRRQQTTTNKKGEFIQIGLFPGNYKVTAEKEKLGSQAFDVRVRLGQTAEVNFQLVPGASAGMSKEEAAKNAQLRQTFEEGVAASRAGNYDEAIAKFQAAAQVNPKCFDCYYNLGYAYAQKKDYDNAEKAYKEAIAEKPDYTDAYNGLAGVYNAQKKFDDAAAMSAKAAQVGGGAMGMAGSGNVDAIYNQGVILWNAGKIPEAKAKFEEAIKVNPNHADSHYQLGMALLNEGKLSEAAGEFETYVKLAPEGQYAAQAKAMVAQLKK